MPGHQLFEWEPGTQFNNLRFGSDTNSWMAAIISFFNRHTKRPESAVFRFHLEVAYRLRDELNQCIKIAEEQKREMSRSIVDKLIDDLEEGEDE